MQKTGIVIPCYNEYDRLDTRQFEEFITTRDDYYLCFVNDGSSDQTATLLKEFVGRHPEKSGWVNLEQNAGKAEAVRQGFLYCLRADRFEYIGFIDADLATPLSQVAYLIDWARLYGKKMIFGSRVKRLGVQIHRRTIRHILGRIFATVISNMLDLPIYDSQCGIKFMTGEYARIAFDKPFLSKWVFDVEIFARLKISLDRMDQDILEVPLLEWSEIGGSKLKISSMLRVPKDLYKIYKNYNLK